MCSSDLHSSIYREVSNSESVCVCVCVGISSDTVSDSLLCTLWRAATLHTHRPSHTHTHIKVFTQDTHTHQVSQDEYGENTWLALLRGDYTHTLPMSLCGFFVITLWCLQRQPECLPVCCDWVRLIPNRPIRPLLFTDLDSQLKHEWLNYPLFNHYTHRHTHTDTHTHTYIPTH